MSYSTIAEHIGVDHVTIGYCRNKLCPTCEIHKSTKRKGADDGGRQALVAKQCCQMDPGSTRHNPARGIMDHNSEALSIDLSTVIGHFCTGQALSGFRTPYRQ
jgi:hypothetical protein